MSDAISEITPLSDKDCFYLVDRHNKVLDYPLHKHGEYELNFIEFCKGVKRTAGDSIEVIGDYDLVLMGKGVEHSWAQHECKSEEVHQITIQFSQDLFGKELLEKNNMSSIRRMLAESSHGIAFGMPTIMRIYQELKVLLETKDSFYRVLQLYKILYELSISDDYRLLSSSEFAHSQDTHESRRVKKVRDYVAQHFKDEIRLAELADLVGMTPTAFSRFFKVRTGKSISDYIIDVRLGYAARKLADSSMSIVEICYISGFNNISYFNRLFKRKKGYTPSEFRNNYKKTKVLV